MALVKIDVLQHFLQGGNFSCSAVTTIDYYVHEFSNDIKTTKFYFKKSSPLG